MGAGKKTTSCSRAIAVLALALGARRLRRGRGRRRQRRGGRPTAKAGPVKGELTISNWPGYIDPGPNGTVAEFEKETGVNVNYIEDINSNDAFFGKLQPLLEQGESGGRSVFVVTDCMAQQMHDLGYLQEIDHADLPTVFENLLPSPGEPRVRPGTQVLGAMAGRHDRDLGRYLEGAGDQIGQRPLRPEIQGQSDDAGRTPGNAGAGDARRRGRPRDRRRRRVAGGDRQTRTPPPIPVRSAASPATTTPRT